MLPHQFYMILIKIQGWQDHMAKRFIGTMTRTPSIVRYGNCYFYEYRMHLPSFRFPHTRGTQLSNTEYNTYMYLNNTESDDAVLIFTNRHLVEFTLYAFIVFYYLPFIMKAFHFVTRTTFRFNYQPSSLPKIVARTYAMAPNQSIPPVRPAPKTIFIYCYLC